MVKGAVAYSRYMSAKKRPPRPMVVAMAATTACTAAAAAAYYVRPASRREHSIATHIHSARTHAVTHAHRQACRHSATSRASSLMTQQPSSP